MRVAGAGGGVDEDLVGPADEGEVVAIGGVDHVLGRGEVEDPLGVSVLAALQLEAQLADGQVRLRPGGAKAFDLLLRLGHRAALEQGAGASEGIGRLRAGGAVRTVRLGAAGPQRRLVQRERRAARIAPDHRAEAAVAEGEGLEPALGGAAAAEGGGGGHAGAFRRAPEIGASAPLCAVHPQDAARPVLRPML